MDVVLNDETETAGFAPPDDGDPGGVREFVLNAPGKVLQQGGNVLRKSNAGSGPS
ncbi:hypothetical protein ACFUTV_22345 [Streptomyces sp. NPDC057298]|uniref:hypothetical protein n=1 Tax=Streptomyces sp. NPDC057298 TaxID=3346091 RepID=UPI0036448EE3